MQEQEIKTIIPKQQKLEQAKKKFDKIEIEYLKAKKEKEEIEISYLYHLYDEITDMNMLLDFKAHVNKRKL